MSTCIFLSYSNLHFLSQISKFLLLVSFQFSREVCAHVNFVILNRKRKLLLFPMRNLNGAATEEIEYRIPSGTE